MRHRNAFICALTGLVVWCGGGGDTTGTTTVPTLVVTAVLVTPNVAQIELGASATFVADIRDQFGAILPGKTVTWTITNTSVATVDAAGVVKGVAAGTTSLSATVDGKSGLATISVIPPAVAS